MIICYVTGACARSVIHSKRCSSCKDILVNDNDKLVIDYDDENSLIASFFGDIDHGGLFVPQPSIIILSTYCWNIFEEINKTPKLREKFRASSNPRLVLSHETNLGNMIERADEF